MKKGILMLVVAFAYLNATAQIDSFDVFTFRPPEFFVRSEVSSALQFSLKSSDGNFCTITLYKSQQVREDSMKVMISQWNEQVLKKLDKANKKPLKVMTGKQWDNWSSIVAIGNFYQRKKKCVVMLNSFVNNQTTSCVVFAFSDPLFKNAIQDFSKNLHLINH